MAREIFKAVPKGNYAIIKGNEADANARFLRGGIRGDHRRRREGRRHQDRRRGRSPTAGSPTSRRPTWRSILTANDNKVDAVLSENDGMAGGVVAALKAQGLAGKVPVSGQDGDQAALNRVALGTQTVERLEGRPRARQGRRRGRRRSCARTRTSPRSPAPRRSRRPRSNTVTLAAPQAARRSLKDNLQAVVDAGWITKDALCKDVPAGSVAACG